jgi:hypothetical protein
MVAAPFANAHEPGQARQTVSFAVIVQNVFQPAALKTITISALDANMTPADAYSLRAIVPFNQSNQQEQLLRDVSAALSGRDLMITISD